MTKELIQEYTARVSQASRSELIVIMYEIILGDITSAQNAYTDGNMEAYTKDLKHAQRFVNELMGALDYSYKISYELMSLYIFINKCIVSSIFKKEPEALGGVKNVLTKLLMGFEEVAKQDSSGSIMKNTQQLYVGLTYGKGVLNETYMDPFEQNRGFKV